MATVPVDLSRDRIHDVDAPESVTVSGPFTVELDNHGSSIHVHLNLDEDLSRVATLRAGNHYVEEGTVREVHVDVEPASKPVTGRLKVVTGYGTETRYVTVTVEPGSAGKPPVEVDESLGKPGGNRSTERNADDPDYRKRIEDAFENSFPRGPQLVLAAVAAGAAVLAIGIGIWIDSTAVLVGTGIVVGAAIAAFVLSQG